MKSQQSVILCSGDELEIGKVRMTFEIRDPNFEKQIQTLPQERSEDFPIVNEGFALATQDGFGGAYPMTADGALAQPKIVYGSEPFALPAGAAPSNNQRTKHIRMAIAALAVVLVYTLLFHDDKGANPVDGQPTAEDPKTDDPLAGMPDEKKRQLEMTYQVAKDLYTRGRFESALFEITKIHEVTPNYKDSKEIANLAQDGINRKREIESLEEEKRLAQERTTKIESGVRACRNLMRQTSALDQLQVCLQPVLELDPGNAEAQQILDSLRMAEDQAKQKLDHNRKAQDRIRAGQELFQRAEALRVKGDFEKATEAYGRHIASTNPDPMNLKEKSKQAVQKIRDDFKSKVDGLVREAQSEYGNKSRKTAFSKLNQALNLDPDHVEGRALKGKIVAELYKEMKVLYSDSVLEESMGNVEQAKEKWKQILETDVPSGEYFNKAKVKMKKYGG
jgi:tetratricopeptide (TPR) repeat protein